MFNLRHSAPFVLIGGALVAGIMLAGQFALHPWVLLLVLGAAAGAAMLFARAGRASFAWICALCAIGAIGALRFQSLEPSSPTALAPSGDAVLEGVVVDDPAERPDVTLLRVQTTRALLDGQPGRVAAGALVLVRAPVDPARRWRYGDALRVEGRVSPPPRIDSFDYRLYLARQGVSLWLPAAEISAAVALLADAV
jgi:predicted membrane metal-binding protein